MTDRDNDPVITALKKLEEIRRRQAWGNIQEKEDIIRPIRDEASLKDAEAVGGLIPTDEPGPRRGHSIHLIAGPSHTMADGKIFLDDKELIGVSRFWIEATGGNPLPKAHIEMRVSQFSSIDLPADLVVDDRRSVYATLDIFEKPVEVTLDFHPIDDIEVEPRALIFRIRWFLTFILRIRPFYLHIAFPTRRKVAGALKDQNLWVKPWIQIGKAH